MLRFVLAGISSSDLPEQNFYNPNFFPGPKPKFCFSPKFRESAPASRKNEFQLTVSWRHWGEKDLTITSNWTALEEEDRRFSANFNSIAEVAYPQDSQTSLLVEAYFCPRQQR